MQQPHAGSLFFKILLLLRYLLCIIQTFFKTIFIKIFAFFSVVFQILIFIQLNRDDGVCFWKMFE